MTKVWGGKKKRERHKALKRRERKFGEAIWRSEGAGARWRGREREPNLSAPEQEGHLGRPEGLEKKKGGDCKRAETRLQGGKPDVAGCNLAASSCKRAET